MTHCGTPSRFRRIDRICLARDACGTRCGTRSLRAVLALCVLRISWAPRTRLCQSQMVGCTIVGGHSLLWQPMPCRSILRLLSSIGSKTINKSGWTVDAKRLRYLDLGFGTWPNCDPSLGLCLVDSPSWDWRISPAAFGAKHSPTHSCSCSQACRGWIPLASTETRSDRSGSEWTGKSRSCWR